MKASDLVTYQGRRVNRRTKVILDACNQVLQDSPYFGQEKSDVHLVQGSPNPGGVAQSAGTHDGGGAIDVTWFNIENRLKVFRMAGIRFWPRPTLPGHWAAHGHGIVAGDPTASRGAHNQRVAYANVRDGLAGNRRDPYWRPDMYDTRAVMPWSSGGGRGIFYVRQAGTVYRSQPGPKCGRIRGRARKNQAVRIVMWIRVYRNGKVVGRYGWTNRGNFFAASALSRKKVK